MTDLDRPEHVAPGGIVPTPETERLRAEAWTWVLRMTLDEVTQDDIAALRHWCALSPAHAEAFAYANDRWRAFGPAVSKVAKEPAIKRSDPFARRERATMARRAFLGGGLAASTAGLAVASVRPPFGLWPSVSEWTADYSTAPGERRQIALGEHTSLELNTRTSLNIQRAEGRIELVAGEAAVTTQARPIEIVAADGQIWADAAEFNVRCVGPEVSVACFTGAVRVTRAGQTVTVRDKEQVTYGEGGVSSIAMADLARLTSWRTGDLYFEDEPLAAVIAEVNRYRRGRIILIGAGLGQRRFSAHYRLDRLDGIIGQLQAVLGLRITALPGGVVLLS
ncbi:FecR domain-containing protein [Bradyrhizobium sp. Ai1a-2]|uniref:FecR family protein n=1 Tax=Bradyrhizobium sp. Ai1a-2 TaxID=196490 RepID=UPI00042022CF|nr:FecR domain-containing protein [Bradyrhizobium sp. Ai1a-2]